MTNVSVFHVCYIHMCSFMFACIYGTVMYIPAFGTHAHTYRWQYQATPLLVYEELWLLSSAAPGLAS